MTEKKMNELITKFLNDLDKQLEEGEKNGYIKIPLPTKMTQTIKYHKNHKAGQNLSLDFLFNEEFFKSINYL
ncbi:hypothetical protein SAMN02745174_02648 [Cetobacterium ceti]|uniref:Uncharacterized protein n=1 Tax=Cetobacterium ceti TaxID=180163 RepID=A0A1T4RDB6_9FUSO|nr:hypothetical protein [Cetobacterium ceti]SKA13786.1 hypothetical protein SAMN02745174_02648 [Cetobacterium ceti]